MPILMNPRTSRIASGRNLLRLFSISVLPLLIISHAASEEEIPVPELVSIPASECWLGPSDDFSAEVLPLRRSLRRIVRIPAYKIGRYEVTRLEYAAFLHDGGYENRSYWSDKGWAAKERYGWQCPRTWFDDRYVLIAGNRCPVVGVSWYEARAYCRWLSAKTGLRFDLPTEDQWEHAAAGPQGFLWPWGNEWDPERCNWGDDTDGNRHGDGGIDGFRFPAPVEYYPKGISSFGCYNMAGNASEWCLDRYSARGHRQGYRVFRGGNWMTVSPRNLTTCFRGGTFPWARHVLWGIIGFRVVQIEQ